jgi:hypothetical protein
VSIDSVLRRQGGVISRHQAVAAGLSPGAVDDLLRRRRWRPLHPQVYLDAGRPSDAGVRMRAALIWAGDGAVLTGAAAAWWYRLLPEPPARISVAVPGRPPRARPGLAVQRRRLPAADLAEHRGLRLTARPLTVLEAAVELGDVGPALLDRVLQGRALQGWLPCAAVHAAHRRHPSASTRRLLDAAARRADAGARRLLVRLLRESGTPGWRCGRAGPAVSFPMARVAVEVTGWAWPVDEPVPRRAAAPDGPGRAGHPAGPGPATQPAGHGWPTQPAGPGRATLPAGPGWTTLHVGWPDLVSRPRQVLADIAAAAGEWDTRVVGA